MKLSSAVLALGFYAPVAKACLAGPFSFEFEGECSRETLLEAYKDQVYSATGAIPRDCTATAEEDFQAKLDAAGTTAQEICDKIYDTAEKVPFTDAAKKGTDMHFEQMFFNGRSDWQEEIETIYETDDESATSVLKRDAELIRAFHDGTAQGRRVAWPGELTNFQSSVTDSRGNATCTTNAAMCCWPKDRQANDGNGNCAKPYDQNCVDKDPADNTNLCFADLDKGNKSSAFDSRQGFMSFPEDNNAGEGAIHCHGLAWAADEYDTYSRYKGNNLFFVSMYDHMHQRGYVEEIPGMPMCGCMEQMPLVTRSDCTQVDVTEDWEVSYNPEGGMVGKITKVDIDFNACRGRNNRNNDLWAKVARLYDEGRVSARDFGKVGQVLTNDHDCYFGTEYAKQKKGLATGYTHDSTVWTQVAGRDELEHDAYGKNAFNTAFFGQTLTKDTTPIIMRICADCVSTHKRIFYKRLTPIDDPNFQLLHNIMYYRNGNPAPDNVWDEDYSLHSTYEDAVSGANPWKCPGDKFNYHAPFTGECSPDGTKVRNQHSYFNDGNGPRKNVAYYINKPEDVGVSDLIPSDRTRSPGDIIEEEIGIVKTTGASFDGGDGTIHVTGSGDIWHQADRFHYIYENGEGDITVKVHLTDMASIGNRGWAKAGIMIRSDNSADATNAFMYLSNSHGAHLQTRRSKTSGTDNRPNKNWHNVDKDAHQSAWLKIVKKMDTIEGYYSLDGGDGGTWILYGTDIVNFPLDKFIVGLAVSNADDWNLAEATFEDYTIDQYIFPTAAPSISLAPTAWNPLVDIDTQRAGELYLESDTDHDFDILKGSGTGLDHTSDSFTYYVEQVPDASMSAALTINWWSNWSVHGRAGIMLRDTLDANSAYVFVGAAGARQGAVMQSRALAGQRDVFHKMEFINNNDGPFWFNLNYVAGVGGAPGTVTGYYKKTVDGEWIELAQAPFTASGSAVLIGVANSAGETHQWALKQMNVEPIQISTNNLG
mmetsp:Transcript_22755/g.52247  ORF Transcript_22755/g.52247 Transcript_22755/m.52247 type:complete len:989 (+) Transcript_22755:238-3204(+)